MPAFTTPRSPVLVMTEEDRDQLVNDVCSVAARLNMASMFCPEGFISQPDYYHMTAAAEVFLLAFNRIKNAREHNLQAAE